MAMALLRRDSKLQTQRKMWEKSPASRSTVIEYRRPRERDQARPVKHPASTTPGPPVRSSLRLRTANGRRSGARPPLRSPYAGSSRTQRSPSRTKMLQRGRESRMTPCSFTTPLPLHWALLSAARAGASQTFRGRQAPPQGRSGPMGAHGHTELLEQKGVKRAGAPHRHGLPQPVPHV